MRLLLPPNLADAITRNAIPIRLLVDLEQPLKVEWLPALARIQHWTGSGQPPALMQLTRAQLTELVELLLGQGVFFRVAAPGTPLAWQGGRLEWVGELLSQAQAKVVAPGSNIPAGAAKNDSGPRGRVEQPEAVSLFRGAGRPVQGGGSIDGSEHFIAIGLPSREHPSYAPLLDALKASGFTLEPSNRKWWLRERHKVLNFLAGHAGSLQSRWGLHPTENFIRNTANLRSAELVGSVEEDRGGFNLTLALRAGQADEGAVRLAVSTGRGYVESGGKVYLLDKAQLDRLTVAQRALTNDPQAGLEVRRTLKIRSARVPEAQEILDELSPAFQAPAAWRVRGESLRQLSTLAPAPMEQGLATRLRPYQRLGVSWLWFLLEHDLGGILADEMGLGKTPQALALLDALTRRRRQQGGMLPHLAVVPASLLENWRREAMRFTPALRVQVHHGGSRAESESAWRAIDLVITSYGTLTRDRALFERVEFDCVFADEAQHIKNRRAQHAKALRAVRSRGRFLLTGTPLENSLDDLRSLFEFLMPGYIEPPPPGLRREDKAWHDERLRARVAPYILRRTKVAVAPELPPKIEQVVWCEMSPAQAALYRELQEKAERELIDLESAGAGEARLRFAMLTQLLRLRQVCCDPRLVGRAPTGQTTSGGEEQPFGDSAKLDALRELIDEARDDGHRVLLFSQFTSLLALLREEFDREQVRYCYIDGAMSPSARQVEVDRFQSGDDIPLFLLSLKAGGTGLNLTGADMVIHFDPWWNPAAEAQATDRAHRIGQSRTVTSYKLICSGSVEERVLSLQEEKRNLLSQVFEASDALSAKLSLGDLRSLLR